MDLTTSTQPQIFPQFYMAQRMSQCRDFVVMEEAQVTKAHCRFTLGTKNGLQVISIPLDKSGGSRKNFNETFLKDFPDWWGKLLTTLELTYRKTRYYDELMPYLIEWGDSILPHYKTMTFADVGYASYTLMARVLKLTARIHPSTMLVGERPDNACEWIAQLVEETDNQGYIQGLKSMDDYFDPEPFEKRNIELFYQKFKVHYREGKFPMIDPTVSWIDWVFKLGAVRCRTLLFDYLLKDDTVVPWTPLPKDD